MHYLISIDVGIVNVGISIIKYKRNTILKIFGYNTNWKYDLKFHIDDLLNDFKRENTIILIERQYIGKTLRIMEYLRGYLDAKEYKFFIVSPITRGKNLKTRKERKYYSINLLKSYSNNISKDISHDTADAINIAVDFLKKQNISIIPMTKFNIE